MLLISLLVDNAAQDNKMEEIFQQHHVISIVKGNSVRSVLKEAQQIQISPIDF